MKRSAVAVAQVGTEVAREPMDRLRRRLAAGGAAAEEAAWMDFLEDDLEEAKVVLEAVSRYVASVAGALRDGRAARRELLALALSGDAPAAEAEHLHRTLASIRRRLARIAARLPA